MFKKMINSWKEKKAIKEKHKELSQIAIHESRIKYPEEKIIREPIVMEDQEGIVVRLCYSSSFIPPLRRFWAIDENKAQEVETELVSKRFNLGPWR